MPFMVSSNDIDPKIAIEWCGRKIQLTQFFFNVVDLNPWGDGGQKENKVFM